MRKSVVMALAGGMTLGIASVASADWIIDVGNFSVGGANQGGSHVVQVGLGAGDAIIGMDFAGDLVGGTASISNLDLLITVQAPSGNIYQFGGYDTTTANPWQHPQAFPGFGSYSADWSGSIPNETREGTWTFTFSYDWAPDGAGAGQRMDWQNVVITMHKIPAPGALALLGVAGLVGTRRRRA